MKCKNCSETISPKFMHSISINVCPFCGENLMDEDLQIALSELMEVMKYATIYKVEIFEWLKSNYNLIDGNSDEYKALLESRVAKQLKVRKDTPQHIELDEKGNQLTGESLQDPAATNVFMNRAGIKDPQDRYKDIVSRIKKASSNTAPEPAETLSMAEAAQASVEDLEAMETILMKGQAPTIHSAIGYSEMDGEESLDPIAESLARMGSGGKAAINPQDLRTLQKMQGNRQASRELREGGSVGLIRRS